MAPVFHGIYHLVCQLQYLVMGKTTDNLSMLYLHRRLALFGNLYDFREVFPAFRILINILATRITVELVMNIRSLYTALAKGGTMQLVVNRIGPLKEVNSSRCFHQALP